MTSKLLVLAICLQGALLLAVQGGQIDNKLTGAEFQRIFHRNRNEEPDYKTVMLKAFYNHRSRRELRPVEFEVDGTKVQLKLTPVKDNGMNSIPVWTVETDRQNSSGRTYRKLSKQETTIDGVFYQDRENMATLLAYYKGQSIYYDGILGEFNATKIVRSVPEKWWKSPRTEAGVDHVIFDVYEEKGSTKALGSQTNSEKLDKPLDVMYPKLLVIVAREIFEALGEDVLETLKYVSTFWNAVNLKFSKLLSPKVKVVVNGIIIAKDDTALRYIYDSRYPKDMNKVDYRKLLTNGDDYFHKYFKHDLHFTNYDSTITMTNLDSRETLGAAYIGQICADYNNIGFVRDDGSYSGVLSATHEVGHLLNMPHDGEGNAASCGSYPDPKISTIMASYFSSTKKYVWSNCSKNIIQKFASTKAAECMRYPS